LSQNLEDRILQLFNIKDRWTISEITPFLKRILPLEANLEKLLSKYEAKAAFFNKVDATKEDITNFFFEKCFTLVGQRTKLNQATRYTKRPLVVVYFTVDFGHLHKDETQFWRQKVMNIARDNPKYSFAVSDEEEFAQELIDAGVGESGLDVNVVVYGIDNKRYPMDPETYEEFDETNFREFLVKIEKGSVKPYIKSQPVPKKDTGLVKVLVGSNIEEISNDESKAVFIEFYAPWCGHCKSLAPIYEQLAAEFKTEANIVIAKFDVTVNDVPAQFVVQGFPTLFLTLPGQKRTPLKYDGERTLEAMSQFLRKNAVASLKSGEKTEL